jgi:hypothetical protein
LTNGTFNPEKRTILPHSAFTGFAARFREPQLKEGFHDIVTEEFQVAHGELVSHANELIVLFFLVSGKRRATPNLESVLDMKLAKMACRSID